MKTTTVAPPALGKIQVRILTSRAGVDVHYKVGQIKNLPTQEAERLVAAGEAEYLTGSADTMRVRIIDPRAGVNASYRAGQEVPIPRDEAMAMIARGEAVSLEPSV